MTGWRADPSTETYDQVRAGVVEAAERWIERNGLAKVRIEEIAEEAGCSRATIYRYFDDKDELIRAVLVRRARGISERLGEELSACDDPADLLVLGLVRGLDEIRSDEYFESFYGPGEAGLTARIAGGSEAMHAVVHEALGPLFELAEATGRLRPDISRDEATEWTIMVSLAHLTIPARVERTDVELEAHLRKFLVPVLFV